MRISLKIKSNMKYKFSSQEVKEQQILYKLLIHTPNSTSNQRKKLSPLDTQPSHSQSSPSFSKSHLLPRTISPDSTSQSSISKYNAAKWNFASETEQFFSRYALFLSLSLSFSLSFSLSHIIYIYICIYTKLFLVVERPRKKEYNMKDKAEPPELHSVRGHMYALSRCPRHCLMGFLKTTSGLRMGRDTRRSILRALFGSVEGVTVPSGPRGVSAIVCQFPVLLGRLPGNCCCCGCCWCCCCDAAAAAAAAFNAGKGVWWQCAQCKQTVQAPSFRANSARSFRAGPSFIPIGPVKWSSERRGNAAPSIRCSRKFCKRNRDHRYFYLTALVLIGKWFDGVWIQR